MGGRGELLAPVGGAVALPVQGEAQGALDVEALGRGGDPEAEPAQPLGTSSPLACLAASCRVLGVLPNIDS